MTAVPDDEACVTQCILEARARLEKALQTSKRNADSAQVLAVSKTKPATLVRAAWQSGQRAFGENYLQEALDKQQALSDLTDIEWHFIGPIQSNKTRAIAEHFTWVHTVEREKIARRLSEQRPDELGALDVCLQYVHAPRNLWKHGRCRNHRYPLFLADRRRCTLSLRGTNLPRKSPQLIPAGGIPPLVGRETPNSSPALHSFRGYRE